MRIRSLFAALAALVLLAGCAHPISMAPDLAALAPRDEAQTSPAVAGFYISPADRAKAVITPGGGGDRVEYLPYRDLEAGIYKTLAGIFREVRALKEPGSPQQMAQDGIQWVITPEIDTDSSSTAVFTWMPTDFTVRITIGAIDRNGKLVWRETVTGTGNAPFGELKSEFGRAARLASQNALNAMRAAILKSPLMKAAP